MQPLTADSAQPIARVESYIYPSGRQVVTSVEKTLTTPANRVAISAVQNRQYGLISQPILTSNRVAVPAARVVQTNLVQTTPSVSVPMATRIFGAVPLGP